MSELTAPSNSPDDRSPVRRAAFRLGVQHYRRQMLRDWRMTVPALLFPALGNVFIFFLPPLVIARVLERASNGVPSGSRWFLPYVAAFGALWLTGEGFWRIGIYFLNRADSRGIESLYNQGMDELLAKDLAFFHDNFGGALTKRLVSYSTRYEEFVDTFSFNVFGNVVPLGVAGVVLWRFSPWLVAALLGMLALTALLVIPLIRRRQAMVDAREAASTVVSGHIADTIANMDAVRAHSAELRESHAHRRNVAEHRRLALRSWDYQNTHIDGVAAPLSVVMNVLGLLIVLRLAGPVNLAAVFVTYAYFAQSTRIVFEFNQIYRTIESCLTEAAQFTELLLLQPEITDPASPVVLAPADTSVHFERMTFAYPGHGSTPLFADFDLRIESGEKVGFVGRSGGGKSTLTKLLLRLMDVDSGRVVIGGHDITELRQADLRSLLAYVPQDPVMFHRSLHDNIAFGRPRATEDDVRAAATAAHAAEFIERLPTGYATLVGERGVKLSGGQRQRVAIARAILRDAPILVLDEATSALDSESEALIQDALLQLIADRTALVVAHRLSTVQRMDRLVVVERGRLVEQGTHDHLLASGGVYARLWRRQSGGFLVDQAA